MRLVGNEDLLSRGERLWLAEALLVGGGVDGLGLDAGALRTRPAILGASASVAAIVGGVVHHKLFDYRGVVYDTDETFGLSEAWYQNVAKSIPPKDEPWYRVLVHDADHETYVAERNLEPDASTEAINHPQVDDVFDTFAGGYYARTRNLN